MTRSKNDIPRELGARVEYQGRTWLFDGVDDNDEVVLYPVEVDGVVPLYVPLAEFRADRPVEALQDRIEVIQSLLALQQEALERAKGAVLVDKAETAASLLQRAVRDLRESDGVTVLSDLALAIESANSALRTAVELARDHDYSWEKIGDSLGISKQAALKRFGKGGASLPTGRNGPV